MLAAGLLLAGCASGSKSSTKTSAPETTGAAATPKAGGELTVADPLPPTSLDPILGTSGGDQMALYPIYDRLINFNPKTLDPEPGLATAWHYTSPTTLVLTLRHGVSFQDGTPFNAAAVKFNLMRAATLKTSVEAADLASLGSVQVTGPYQVTLHLKQPDAALVLTLADRAGMMASPAAVKKWGASYGSHPVGTGPYAVSQYVPNVRLVLKKNPHYWQAGKPYLNGITFEFFTDQQTANNAVEDHQAQVELNVALSDISTLKAVSGLQVVSARSLYTDGCYLNTDRPPLNNVLVREAVAIAINRTALNQVFAFGQAAPASEFYPSGYWAFDPAAASTFGYNPAKARALLKRAGYPKGVTIKGLGYQTSAEARLLQVIQQQLKSSGINMTFSLPQVATAAQDFFVSKTYNMICSSWSGRPDPSQTATELLAATSFYNAGAYSPPGMASALAAAAGDQTQSGRAAALSKITALNQKYVVWLPLLNEPNVTAIDSTVHGLVPNLYGKIDVSFLWLN
jgi:peptide/nickel transport system substrate-binding protein